MKLNHEEADKYVYLALLDAKFSPLRFGQALWNALPKEVTNPHHGTETDFFYTRDNERVKEIFYKYYVEN